METIERGEGGEEGGVVEPGGIVEARGEGNTPARFIKWTNKKYPFSFA
jgi:hypothetical protein